MRRLIVVPVALIMLFWVFSLMRTPEGVMSAPLHRDPAARQSAPDSTGTLSSLSSGARHELLAKSAAPLTETLVKPFEFTRELTTFTELKAKVFLTDDEKEVKRALLSHVLLMRAVAKRLVQPSVSESLVHEQEAGVDLLLAAYKDGDRSVAAEILRDVVSDRQVEDVNLPNAVRNQLAGVKAEILYQWSAIAPELASDMARWLPGPVSEKIWANVTKKQQANLAESEAERHQLTR